MPSPRLARTDTPSPNLVLIYGTRPEALKLGPIAAELRNAGVPFRVLCTGQHTSLLRGTPAESDLAFGESLGLASDGGVTRYIRSAQARIATWLTQRELPAVVVQGDTMTAYAAAQAAAEVGSLLIHVEAGVRSHDLNEPFPEERFRVEITQLADFHLAPTSTAYANLMAEGVRPASIRVTGNPIVSAMARYCHLRPQPPTNTVVITLHRRELTERKDFPQIVKNLYDAIRAHADLTFVWPVHPRVKVSNPPPNLTLAEPVPYRTFLTLVASAHAILTDSGGLTEEACTLGVPTVVLRNVTDRPEALEAETAKLIPPDRVAEAVHMCAHPWISRLPSDAYGGTDAAKQCADAIIHFLGA